MRVDGQADTFDEDGKLRTRMRYVDGKLDGKPQQLVEYVDGQREGWSRTWRADGGVESECRFVKGEGQGCGN